MSFQHFCCCHLESTHVIAILEKMHIIIVSVAQSMQADYSNGVWHIFFVLVGLGDVQMMFLCGPIDVCHEVLACV